MPNYLSINMKDAKLNLRGIGKITQVTSPHSRLLAYTANAECIISSILAPKFEVQLA